MLITIFDVDKKNVAVIDIMYIFATINEFESIILNLNFKFEFLNFKFNKREDAENLIKSRRN